MVNRPTNNENLPSNHLAFALISGSPILHKSSLKKRIMQTLKELIQSVEFEIREKGIDNALDLLASFDRYVGEDWKCYCYPAKNGSQYYVLHQDDDFKLVLIYWKSYDKSKKHGHMKGGGLMRVLSGRLKETRFNADDVDSDIGTFTYAEGDLSYIHDALAFHVVENQEAIPAVSLHLYCTGTDSTFGLLEDLHSFRLIP